MFGSDGYDSALTVFSPDGHLHQVEYAMEAVKRGQSIIGIVGNNFVILASERKAARKLEVKVSVEKIMSLDDHIFAGFAGLTADARVLLSRVRIECQSHYLRLGEPAKPKTVARYISSIQQRYTMSGGRRPFGLTILLAGLQDGKPSLFTCDPSGVHFRWNAASAGKNDKELREALEKGYEENMSEAAAIKLAMEVLDTTVDNAALSLVQILYTDSTKREVPQEELEEVLQLIKEEQDAKKRREAQS